jgi:hypothetical protein
LRINGIPEERITEITAMTEEEAIAAAEEELENASRARQALIQAIIDQAAQAAAEQALLNLERTRYASVVVSVVGNALDFLQHGSPHTAEGLTVVGEAGPELVHLPLGARVDSADRTAEIMRNASGANGHGAATVNHTTIHMPAGTVTTTVNDLRRYLRRNGSTVGATAAP